MHEVLRSHKYNPTQKFHQNFINFEKPQNFQQIPKSGSECMNMYDERQEKRSYLWKMQANDQGKSREDEVVKLIVFGSERDEKLSREIEEIRSKIATCKYIETS